jgi:hypothetical protein
VVDNKVFEFGVPGADSSDWYASASSETSTPRRPSSPKWVVVLSWMVLPGSVSASW